MKNIIVVNWIDTHHSSGWQSLKEAQAILPCDNWTVGYCLSENDSHITVAQSIAFLNSKDSLPGDSMTYDSIYVIPRQCVKSVSDLIKEVR